jgi:hypothetical protein
MQIPFELLQPVPLRRRVLERVPRKHLRLEALGRAARAHCDRLSREERGVAVCGESRVVVEAGGAEVGEFGGGGGWLGLGGHCCLWMSWWL